MSDIESDAQVSTEALESLYETVVQVLKRAKNDVLKNGTKWASGEWVVKDFDNFTDPKWELCQTKFCTMGAIEMSMMLQQTAADQQELLTAIPEKFKGKAVSLVSNLFTDQVVYDYATQSKAGQLYATTDVGRMATIQLARAAINHPLWTGYDDEGFAYHSPTLDETEKSEENHVGQEPESEQYNRVIQFGGLLISWNDQDDRTIESIIQCFTKAIANVESKLRYLRRVSWGY